ncbi:histidine kinase [Massilia sp. MP_M2]|uniref:sensor histidine kinase n=1 Tax=Massilia sp. MP_M2 TaxID=3071713 RepID=UPI00319D9EFB
MRHLTEGQMLVNQALVDKIIACQHSEASLRTSEQQLHALLAHQRASSEAERKRISREIHDCLGQNLLALRLDIVTLHQQTDDRHGSLHDWVSAALGNIDETLRTVKHLLSELRPAGLELGVVATLEIEACKFTRASGIVCDVQADGRLDDLQIDEAIVLSLYRVLRESLDNVCRHSLASRVQLHLAANEDMLELSISDNGVGFTPQAPRKSGSFGLATQQEQVSAYGGTLVVDSAHLQGACLVVRLPLTSSQGGLKGIGRLT